MSQFFASGRQKYWSFNFSINPCSEYSGLISFRMDWFNILAVQVTLKSLLQHHSSKASILLFGSDVLPVGELQNANWFSSFSLKHFFFCLFYM